MGSLEILREQWMWNPPARRIWLWAFFALGALACVLLFPSQGSGALAMGLLPFLGSGVIIGLIYGQVGKRVQVLKESLAGEEGEQAEALAQIGRIQSPAIAIMKAEALVLSPLVGERLVLPFSQMESIREGRNLYGKGFVWKRVFLVKAPQNRRIGFAVAPSVADRWRRRLPRAARVA